ncbi:MAG TPA: dihydrodipicolinate synthase family protein [Acidimicrobiales bacterium]|nr:dihydrodipicolinate synthase family protein [Acidimicrobiales bacterium]
MTAARLPPIRAEREIDGISAVLLPWTTGGTGGATIDWAGFERHLAKTIEAGLTPAVNMDTGYVQLLDDDQRREVLHRTREIVGHGGRFVAGAWVGDEPGAAFAPDRYRAELDAITTAGGTPIVFPSYGLSHGRGDVVDAHAELARDLDAFLAFELSPAFTPAGRIYDLDTFSGLLAIPQCVGAKHSSLRRQAEWDRLALRDERRPDFRLYTGNDLAIDMVIYGSDYLLGLSSFAPDAFARRDARWAKGDPAFFELNDTLQYLGRLAFRAPVPAYKHSAAQFLVLRGWLDGDATPPGAPRRPAEDVALLQDIAAQL